MSRLRHSWSEKHRPDEHHTLRRCWRCGLFEITRHEASEYPPHWKEYRRDGDLIRSDQMPECVAVEVMA